MLFGVVACMERNLFILKRTSQEMPKFHVDLWYRTRRVKKSSLAAFDSTFVYVIVYFYVMHIHFSFFVHSLSVMYREFPI